MHLVKVFNQNFLEECNFALSVKGKVEAFCVLSTSSRNEGMR